MGAHSVRLCRGAVIKPNPKSDPSRSLLFKRLPDNSWYTNFPSTSVPRWAGVICTWCVYVKVSQVQLSLFTSSETSPPSTFQCSALLSCFRWMWAVGLAFFTSHEGLFDAQGLSGGFGGRFGSAAGCADPHKATQTFAISALWWRVVNNLKREGVKFSVPHHVVFFDFPTDQFLTCHSRVLQWHKNLSDLLFTRHDIYYIIQVINQFIAWPLKCYLHRLNRSQMSVFEEFYVTFSQNTTNNIIWYDYINIYNILYM